ALSDRLRESGVVPKAAASLVGRSQFRDHVALFGDQERFSSLREVDIRGDLILQTLQGDGSHGAKLAPGMGVVKEPAKAASSFRSPNQPRKRRFDLGVGFAHRLEQGTVVVVN